jgi:hypothetical protein
VRVAAFAIALTATCSVMPRHAYAQDEGVAEALYREGQQLIGAGKVHEACVKFAESERIDPATGTLMATAACHEKEGKLATAWAEFTDAVNMAGRAHEPDRERYARAHAATLEKSLYRFTLDLPSPPMGTEVKIDARALGVGALGSAIPLDPGRHHIEVAAPHMTTWTRDIDVPETAGTERLTVSLEGAHEASPVDPPKVKTDGPGLALPAAIGGAGVAAIATGVVLLITANGKGNDAVSDAKAATNMTEYSNAQNEHDSAATLQAAGLVIGGVGVVAAAIGTVLLVKAKSAHPSSTSRDASVRVTPSAFPLFPHGGGLGLGGTF